MNSKSMNGTCGIELPTRWASRGFCGRSLPGPKGPGWKNGWTVGPEDSRSAFNVWLPPKPNPPCQLDPQSLVVQSVGVLFRRPSLIAGKLPWPSAEESDSRPSLQYGRPLFCGPRGQTFAQPGPFGPGKERNTILLRPKGPVVRFFDMNSMNDRPVGPQEMSRSCLPGPQGPGWRNGLGGIVLAIEVNGMCHCFGVFGEAVPLRYAPWRGFIRTF